MSRATADATGRFVGLVSVWLLVALAAGDARPQYGGTLRVETSASMRTLDPAAPAIDASDAAARGRLLPLVFETLVAVDGDGRLAPSLAASWDRDAKAMRWRLRLRSGIILHDGSKFDAPQAVAILRGQGPWKVAADGDAIVIDADRESPDLPWELASIKHAMVVRRGATLLGTGPFRVDRFEPAAAAPLLLRAHEDYWKGRPFVDFVQVSMGRAAADQLASLETGRADLVGVDPPDAARLAARGLRVVSSAPIDLVALLFEEHRAVPAAQPLRKALAAALDRSSLCAAVLQRRAQPAATLLPDWLTGYASVLAPDADRARAKSLVAAVPAAQRSLALRVESPSPIDRAIAERIAVDARDAGLTIRVDPAGSLAPRADVRLVRASIEPASPDRALSSLVAALGSRAARVLPADTSLPPAASLDDVYRRERSLLDGYVLVPVAHLPDTIALGARVQTWSAPAIARTGAWDLADLWIGADRP